MEANQTSNQVNEDQIKRKPHIHEGPKNHLLAFLFSIILTVLAFIAVAYQSDLEKPFVPMFIVALALIQAVTQALFWMHLKDGGHFQQRLFLVSGAFVALTCVIMAVYWVWW